ncbi:MAG: NAD(P)H-hydrate dehydratase [Tenericutes bacterium 4572_104]|nr:MAG: NAD(P)H-hydrate dehydratase [Tenericutes bacterium 4572_104]
MAIKANFTGVVGLYKIGNLINDAMDYHGEMKLLDINIIKETSLKSKFIEIDKYHLTLKKRLHNSHKYSYGLGVFIGGSKAMMGSIQMSAMAGLKSGLGIVKILTEENNFTQFYPELIIDYNLGNNTIPELEKAKVVVFGPGIKKNTNHQILLNYLLEKDIPLIIDGSGFLYIEPKSYKNKNIILTPHLGELAKFLRVEQKEILNAPLKYLKEITDLGFHILLKGPCNILASQDEIRFIQVNNTGLATAGSGDVLTGIISGMLANNLDILKALTDSIFIQQVSSDYAKDLYGETSIIATDILNNIYKVLKEYENV